MIDSMSIVDTPNERKTIMADKVARTIVKAREHDYSSMDEWTDETEDFGEEAYSYHMDNGQIGLVQNDGDGVWLAMIGDDMDQIADGLGFYAEEDLKDLREARGWIYAMDERAAGEKYNPDGTLRPGDIKSWKDTPKKTAAGRHSDPYDSELKDFVDELIQEIKNSSMWGVYNRDHYIEDGDVWTFTIDAKDLQVYVAIDGTTVRMEPDFAPEDAVDYPLDTEGGEFNVTGEAYAILDQIDSYKRELDYMLEEDPERFAF